MQVIWQTPLDKRSTFDREYVEKVLLVDVECEHFFDEARYERICNHGVVVFATHDPDITHELRQYLNQCQYFSLIQLWLERLVHDTSYYKNARTIFRPYYDPRIKDPNVYFLPVGFQSGFLNENYDAIDFDMKTNVWCFAGQLKSHRKKMIKAMQSLQPHFTYFTKQWADPNALTPEDMRSLYKKTIFVPCPYGNRNPDSYRVMECLEYGCIPVVLNFLGEDYFKNVFGDHPFILASTWADAAAQMQALMRDPEALRARQLAVHTWYRRFKQDLAHDIRTLLRAPAPSPAPILMSVQFTYQRAPKKWYIPALYNLYYGHGLHRRLFRFFINM